MPTLTATGIGSGMDLSSLVSQLVSADRAPQELRLNRQELGAKAKLSALGTVTSALDALQRSLAGLNSGSAFTARSASSSAPTVFTASAAAGAPTGSFEVEVLSRASAHKLVSGALPPEQSLGAGRLRIELGDESFSVDIAADASTPAAIAAAVRDAARDAGVSLSVTSVNADAGTHLVFASGVAGSANSLRITRESGDPGLDALVYDPGTLTSLSEQTAASDAQVRIDGLLRTAQGNTLTDLVPGLTLNLLEAAPGAVHRVTIGSDSAAARTALQGFVTAYNAAVTAMGSATKYDASTRTAAALNGDSMVRGATDQLRSALGAALAGAAEAGLPASQLGLNTRTDGTLVFDGARFEAALAADPGALTAALGSGTGLAGRLDGVLDGLLASDGPLRGRSQQLNATIDGVGRQRDRLDARMLEVETRYRAQYAALDSLVAQLQNTGNFLAQQLSSL